jgi:hypothetical protein
VLLLQPLFKCWTGRCSTCRQPVDLDHIPLVRLAGTTSDKPTKHY